MKARVMNELDILKRTIDYYDKNAESWSRSHCYKQEQSFWKEEMEKFHELLPKGKVIEIGSGSGKDAKALVDFGKSGSQFESLKNHCDCLIYRCSGAGGTFWLYAFAGSSKLYTLSVINEVTDALRTFRIP